MHISITAETLFSIFAFPVTNSMIVSWAVIGVFVVLSFFVTRNIQSIPRGIQNCMEMVIEFILGMMDSVTGNREETKRFFPLIATIFLFVIAVNWAGLLPGTGTIGLKEIKEGHEKLIPFIRSSSADLNFTVALALISFATIHITGIISIGFFKYASRYVTFKNPLDFFVGILELVSELSKLISFSFRLFGNIFAGEVLLTVMLFLVPYVVPLPFMALEIFVGFIQALVFAMLTLVFVKIATVDTHH